MILRRVLHASKGVFAPAAHTIRHITVARAKEGRCRKFKNEVPSDETILAFRARHLALSYIRVENKAGIKLKG